MLNDRLFQVVMGSSISSPRKVKNGVLQGSVLASFLLYIGDIPKTKSRNFGYANGWILGYYMLINRLARANSNEGPRYNGKEAPLKRRFRAIYLNNTVYRRELNIQFQNVTLTIKHQSIWV